MIFWIDEFRSVPSFAWTNKNRHDNLICTWNAPSEFVQPIGVIPQRGMAFSRSLLHSVVSTDIAVRRIGHWRGREDREGHDAKMMNAAEFRGWRKTHGLTQQQAAKLLNRSVMTIRQYERGETYDAKPRLIPEHIERMCREYSGEQIDAVPPMKLDFHTVSRDDRHTIIDKLAAHGVQIDPERSIWFERDYFENVWIVIYSWLRKNVHKGFYLLLNLEGEFSGVRAAVLIQFSNRHDALNFFERFRNESDQRTLHCNLRVFAKELAARANE